MSDYTHTVVLGRVVYAVCCFLTVDVRRGDSMEGEGIEIHEGESSRDGDSNHF